MLYPAAAQADVQASMVLPLPRLIETGSVRELTSSLKIANYSAKLYKLDSTQTYSIHRFSSRREQVTD